MNLKNKLNSDLPSLNNRLITSEQSIEGIKRDTEERVTQHDREKIEISEYVGKIEVNINKLQSDTASSHQPSVKQHRPDEIPITTVS